MSTKRKDILKNYRRQINKTHDNYLRFKNPFGDEASEPDKMRLLLHKHDIGLANIHKDFNAKIELTIGEIMKNDTKRISNKVEIDKLKLAVSFLTFTILIMGIKVFFF